jgi:hypothetical protein
MIVSHKDFLFLFPLLLPLHYFQLFLQLQPPLDIRLKVIAYIVNLRIDVLIEQSHFRGLLDVPELDFAWFDYFLGRGRNVLY